MAKDLLGREMTDWEARLVEAYEALARLAASPLPPTAAANVREAMASLWQAVNGLALVDDRPDI